MLAHSIRYQNGFICLFFFFFFILDGKAGVWKENQMLRKSVKKNLFHLRELLEQPPFGQYSFMSVHTGRKGYDDEKLIYFGCGLSLWFRIIKWYTFHPYLLALSSFSLTHDRFTSSYEVLVLIRFALNSNLFHESNIRLIKWLLSGVSTSHRTLIHRKTDLWSRAQVSNKFHYVYELALVEKLWKWR